LTAHGHVGLAEVVDNRAVEARGDDTGVADLEGAGCRVMKRRLVPLTAGRRAGRYIWRQVTDGLAMGADQINAAKPKLSLNGHGGVGEGLADFDLESAQLFSARCSRGHDGEQTLSKRGVIGAMHETEQPNAHRQTSAGDLAGGGVDSVRAGPAVESDDDAANGHGREDPP
jgi:hypothetical protein